MELLFKKLNELTAPHLFLALKLRQDIFCIEQNCLYPDLDDTDHTAIQVLALQDNNCYATARIYSDNKNIVHIGRIAVDKKHRSTGLGHKMVLECLNYCEQNFNNAPIEISAQLHLLNYYNKLGFIELEASYFEDGIPHIKMRLAKN
jgi:ElaA protein